MRFVYKGKFDGNYDNLPRAELPDSAVCYEEPDNIKEITVIATKLGIVLIVPVIIAAAVKGYIAFKAGYSGIDIIDSFMVMVFPAVILFFISLFPHELIHGICWPGDAEVGIYNALRQGVLFVTSTEPMTKKRFIWMSAAPNIVFGIIPFIIFVIMPFGTKASSFMGWFSLCSLSGAGGDLMNIINTIKQVPDGSMVAMSGIHTYWYMEDEDGKEGETAQDQCDSYD